MPEKFSAFEEKARELIEAGYCGTCKTLCGGHVICGTGDYPCGYPVWEPLRQNDELFISAIAKALEEERERAAKLATEIAQSMSEGYERTHCEHCRDGEIAASNTGFHIASAIRGENDNG